jgi:xylan 1,4-beta-xylosidase
LNRLGPTELKSSDPSSWICSDNDGGVQALVWEFTNTLPGRNMINQAFYKRDLPSQPKNKVTPDLSHLPKGKYTMETYKVGYRVNDAYDTYRDLGTPAQLTPAPRGECREIEQFKTERSLPSVMRAETNTSPNTKLSHDAHLLSLQV